LIEIQKIRGKSIILKQNHRLSTKILYHVFVTQDKERLGCFLFKVQALTELASEVYFPWHTQPGAILARQLVMTAISNKEPSHKSL
jgi:hypothetical protein